mmetsp:Transcript_5777/g.17177  ORF Transcript_5777/g.17177 Transcript_5777/m.17177 type:complete len:623 (+) Transcript_5777:277-2145(+)
MDFTDIATATHSILSRSLAAAAAANNNDDFVNLEEPVSSSHAHADDYYSTTTNYDYTVPGSTTTTTTTRPFLSKSAEAELYLLATNFLLYVAMVIITTIVAKIYFPESLDRTRGTPRSYSFRRSAHQKEHGTETSDDEFYDIDEGDGYHDDDEYDDDIDDEMEVLDSGDDDDDDDSDGGDDENSAVARADGRKKNAKHVDFLDARHDENGLIHTQEADFLFGGNGGTAKETKSLLGVPNGGGGGGGAAAVTATGLRSRKKSKKQFKPDFLEFDQERLSKAQVMQRLLFCSFMLNVTFVAWGVLQERMLTRRYPRYTGDYFTYSYALVFTNRFWTLIMSGFLLLYLKPRMSKTTVIYEYSFPSISNMLSSWCQYEALRYVSFPATTLFKSFKLGPVMAMGKILGNKTYPAYDYVVALVIGLGITMFMSSTDELNLQAFTNGAEPSAAWTGVMLLFLFLFFDSFTSQFQSRMFQRHADLSMVELMFATSAFSTLLSAITLVHTNELTPALEFVYAHSEIHLHFFMFSICSTIGQLLIFYTIKNFGAVVFTLIMTTRILLSIALSCLMYGHQITGVGFLGLMLVLSAVLYHIKRKAETQQLIKWQGMSDDKGLELVQEWHEHLDM